MTAESGCPWRTPTLNQVHLIAPGLDELVGCREWIPAPTERDGMLMSAHQLVAERQRTSAEVAGLLGSRAFYASNAARDGQAGSAALAATSGGSVRATWIVAGHQPQLYHAGVLFKHFVIEHVARTTGAHALNVVIDNDLCRSTSIRVPAGVRNSPRVEHIPLDVPDPSWPYEERLIGDQQLWASFAERVTAVVPRELPEPMLSNWWPEVVQLSREETKLGACLAMARHRWELAHGLGNSELALSDLCQLECFGRFAAPLVWHAPLVRDRYNEALATYRRRYHVRSSAHPAPDLQLSGPWCEVPFWMWSAESPRRSAVFARRDGSELMLGDGSTTWLTLKARTPTELAECWFESSSGPVRLRPRALMTTLFLRAWLSDLFVHGIGGAKYDRVTDALMAEFYGVHAPLYAVASASIPLQLDVDRLAEERHRALRQRLRELDYHGERFVEPAVAARAEVREVIDAKRREAARVLPAGAARRQRHATLVECNRQLQPLVRHERDNVFRALDELESPLRAVRLWGSREFAFCLHAEDYLLERLRAPFGTVGGAQQSAGTRSRPVRGANDVGTANDGRHTPRTGG